MDVDVESEEVREFAFRHPSPGRYLISPAAFPVGSGRGYFSQKEAIFSEAEIGLSGGLTGGIGTSVPLLFSDESAAGVFMLRGAAPVRPDLYVGGSLNLYAGASYGDGAYGAMPTIDVTWGTPDGHLTARVGQPLFSTADEPLLPMFVVLAGERRLRDRLSLVVESVVTLDFYGEPALETRQHLWPGGAVRILGRHTTVDLGLVPIVAGRGEVFLFPVPWIDVSAYWGGR